MCNSGRDQPAGGELWEPKEREKQGQEESVFSAPTVNGKSLCSKVLIVCVCCFAAKQNRNKPNVCDTLKKKNVASYHFVQSITDYISRLLVNRTISTKIKG